MDIIVRATAIFFFLWLLMRALGKRELSQISPFELVLLIVIGDMVQQGITQEDNSVTGAVLAVGTIALWVLILSYATWRWPRSRPLLEGVPVVLVRDGRVIEEALAIERLPINELLEEARGEGIGDLASVRLAVLEPSGAISFLQ